MVSVYLKEKEKQNINAEKTIIQSYFKSTTTKMILFTPVPTNYVQYNLNPLKKIHKREQKFVTF